MYKLFWGYLLLWFHVKINGLDLLPNFLGYFLVAFWCGGLPEEILPSERGRKVALFLGCATLVVGLFSLFGMGVPSWPGLLLRLVMMALSLWLLWLVDRSAEEQQRLLGCAAGAEGLQTLWIWQAAMNVLANVASFRQNNLTVWLSTAALLVAVVLNVWWLVRCHRMLRVMEAAAETDWNHETEE